LTTNLPEKGYGSTKNRDILLRIKNEQISKFEPIFEPTSGFRYSNLSEFDVKEQENIISWLLNEGFVSPELQDRFFQCKACKSAEFLIQASCVVCKSSNLVTGSVVEHLSCGNLDFDTNYVSKDDNNAMICPKCRKRLRAIGVDYSRSGIFYKCLKCNAMTPECENKYMCFKCGTRAESTELGILELKTYNTNQSRVAQYFMENNYLPQVVERLRDVGISATSPGVVDGLSKIKHTFDLIISHHDSGEPILLADILNSDDTHIESQGLQILAFYAKVMDANLSMTTIIKKILISGFELGKNARNLADAYGITIIQSTSDPHELTSKIIHILSGA